MAFEDARKRAWDGRLRASGGTSMRLADDSRAVHGYSVSTVYHAS